MSQETSESKLSPAQQEFVTQRFRVQPYASAHRMWERLFTPSEREQLGGDPVKAWKQLGTAGMWAKVRGTSPDRAVVDVAVGIGHMSQTNYEWVLREMGEVVPAERRVAGVKQSSPPETPRPNWNRETGELSYDGEVIRIVRLRSIRDNIVLILDVFQEESWPARIDDPLPEGPNPQRIHQTLQSLNTGLKRIRFHALEGGRAIRWSPNELPVSS